MKKHNLLNLIVLPLLFVSCVFAQKSITLEELKNMNKKPKAEKKVVNNEVPKTVEAPKRPGMNVNLDQGEVLAEGSYSKIENPFIYVARTKEDYENLKGLVEGFSSDKQIDFTKQAVVAAFAGMKNSGGYEVSIYKMQGRVNILTKNPPQDAMVTQAITYPYKIAVIDVQEEDSLSVAFSDDFKKDLEVYKVTSATFEFEGGFIGRQTKFLAEGTINVMKYNDLITFVFDLKGQNEDTNRLLNEVSSGKFKNDSASVSRVEAGNFIDKPHPPLNVSAKFEGNKLSMNFEPGKRNYVVNDGFVGRGSLEATKIQDMP